ncbi:hypothetical protein [uncultured Devosia sp.]|uniref:hypothetical protein n=1 Tax=uncultured Devosia sp. TaxID=211434 RepID=UPI0035CAE8D3
MQSERSDEENEQALLAAQDVAVALRTDIVDASKAGNRENFTRLYHEFAAHI